ncbi:secretory calcium-binding phosphoprotein 1 isoform X2 [Leuresthes tenuis]|uniref:secretory calcium-binding phosphoprotein 1 isoform X2 n=1 Tax=Leuresthes tenuis TaxID=355514 RepID=UPI003B506EC2
MKVTIITFCLIGSVFANPIFHNALVSSELDSNSTESLSVSQSSENSTSELQSSEENTSNQSSESESLESTSEDTTSEESNSESDEDNGSDSMAETRDNSMGSEENIRKSWVRVFASVVKVLSAEDNTSTEVKGHSEYLSNELTINQPSHTSTSTKAVQSHANLPLLNNPTDSSDTASDSADTSDSTDATAATSDSSESTSSESQESKESNSNSESTESSDASESSELKQLRAKDCVNGTQSCESEEYFHQSIGDDAHFSVDHLMVPDEDDRELQLRR